MVSKVENQFLQLSDLELLLLSSIVDNTDRKSDFRELKKYSSDYIKNGLLPLFYYKYNGCLHQDDKIKARKIRQESLLVEKLTLNEISIIIKKLQSQNIPVIVLKGWGLKKTLYTESYLRPAADIDLMVQHRDYKFVKELFYKNGFFMANGWQPELTKFQICLRKKLYNTNFIEVDLHFEFSPEAQLSNVIDFDLLRKNSILAMYGDFCLYTLNYPMSLLHSIIHLALHIKNQENYKLIWFVDIYLLVSKMTSDDLKVFVDLVCSTGFNNVVKVFLKDLYQYPEYKNVDEIVRQIGVSDEKRFDFIIDNKSNFRFKLKKYFTLYKVGGFKSISQVLFPSERHMHNKYGEFPKRMLIYYYMKRILKGIF